LIDGAPGVGAGHPAHLDIGALQKEPSGGGGGGTGLQPRIGSSFIRSGR
jgi:hypothetical protein